MYYLKPAVGSSSKIIWELKITALGNTCDQPASKNASQGNYRMPGWFRISLHEGPTLFKLPSIFRVIQNETTTGSIRSVFSDDHTSTYNRFYSGEKEIK